MVASPHPELHVVAAPDGHAAEVWRGEERLARLAAGGLEPDDGAVLSAGEARWLLEQAERHAAAAGFRSVELRSGHPVVREAARRRGYEGGLGAPLTASSGDRPAGDAAARDDRDTALAVGALVPGVHVVARRRSGLAAWAANAMSGVRVVSLEVAADDGGARVEVLVPSGDGLLVEQVAHAVAVLAAVRRRFPNELRPLRRVAFDRASHALKYDRHGGEADLQTGTIHVNAGYVVEGELAALGEGRRTEVRGRPVSMAHVPQVAQVMAHELWHHVELVFNDRRYRDSIEFRRRLGEHYGVATLEHVLYGGARGAHPDWQTAFRRLCAEVSDYAGTNALEATAELFTTWWFSGGQAEGIVARFGELVDEFLPPPA